MRVILSGALVTCNNLVQDLYTIIARSFPESQVESMRQEAGSSYYPLASGDNWNSASTLYGMVAAFLITYNKELINGKMPADFPANFIESQNAFAIALANYSVAKDNITKGGDTKHAANNAVYATLMQMLNDGKAIFCNNPAMRKFFSFAALVKMVSGPGKTGIRFKLQQEVTLLTIGNATITMQPGNRVLYTDQKGIVVQLMPAGKYTFTVTTPGMKPVTKPAKITAGVVSHIKLILTTAVEQTPAPETIQLEKKMSL